MKATDMRIDVVRRELPALALPNGLQPARTGGSPTPRRARLRRDAAISQATFRRGRPSSQLPTMSR